MYLDPCVLATFIALHKIRTINCEYFERDLKTHQGDYDFADILADVRLRFGKPLMEMLKKMLDYPRVRTLAYADEYCAKLQDAYLIHNITI